MIPAVMAFLQSIGMCFLPDSPKWLMEKGRLEEAKIALSEIYGSQYLLYEIDNVFMSGSTSKRSSSAGARRADLPQDLLDYQAAAEKQERASRASADKITGSSPTNNNRLLVSYDSDMFDPNVDDDEEGTTTVVFKSSGPSQYSKLSTTSSALGSQARTTSTNGKDEHGVTAVSPETGMLATATEAEVIREFRLAVVVIIVVQVLAQATGGNVVRNYAPTIFEDSGVSEGMSLTYNVVLGAVKLLFTLLSVYFIDSSGRRSLMLYGIVLVAGGMLFLTLASFFSDSGNLSNPAVYSVGCALVYAGFGIGYGPIPWILSSELFPTVIRARLMSISLVASNVAQLVTNMLFLLMTDHLSTAGTFGFFFAVNVATWLLAYLFLVETKEISPGDILLSLRTNCQSVTAWLCCCCAPRDAETYHELSQSQHNGGGSDPKGEQQESVLREVATTEHEQGISTENILHK